MRQVLIAEAERRSAQKREGGLKRVTFSDLNVATEAPEIDLLALEEAMTALGRVDERFTRVIELRYFAGMQPGGDRGAHRTLARHGEA